MNTPVVLIHGMWSTPDALVDLKASFERQGYEVHVPRLPHHYPRNEMNAQARRSLANTGIEDYVASLSRFIEGLTARPILVGHSMGALLAQLIAARHDCEKLILLSSAAPAGVNSWRWSVVRTFGHNLLKFPLWKTTTHLLLKNIVYGIANSQSASTHHEIIRKATFESGLASTQIGLWFLFRRPPSRVNYNAIRCPVLIIGGSEDKITPLGIQRKIAKRFLSPVELKVIDGACHWTIGGKYFPQIEAILATWLDAPAQTTVVA